MNDNELKKVKATSFLVYQWRCPLCATDNIEDNDIYCERVICGACGSTSYCEHVE